MVLGEESQSEKLPYYYSDSVTLWKRQKWFPGAGGRGDSGDGQWSMMVSQGWTHIIIRFSKAVD